VLQPSSVSPYALAQGDPRFSCLSVNSSSAKAHSISRVARILSPEFRVHRSTPHTAWNNHYAFISPGRAVTFSPMEQHRCVWVWIISEVAFSWM
jgi:hypothetical protein